MEKNATASISLAPGMTALKLMESRILIDIIESEEVLNDFFF